MLSCGCFWPACVYTEHLFDDREFLHEAQDVLRFSTGNLYLNDKSTGSVVCQQPFGGARKSGQRMNY